MTQVVKRLRVILFSENSLIPVSVFRVFWGILMGYNFFELLTARGEFRYFNTVFHFRYPGFEFIPVVNDQVLMVVFATGVLASVFFFLGCYFKLASRVLFLIYLYVFLIDQAYFNNHYYLYLLINLFFLVVPANQHFSLDKKLKKVGNVKGQRWMLLLFQLQICIVYFYGGVSKLLNPEWLSGLAAKTLYTNISNRLEWGLHDDELAIVVNVVTFGGLFFDLLVPFGLMSNRKLVKLVAIVFVVFFHISNAITLQIGTFPFAMIATIGLFISPVKDVPQRELIEPVSLQGNSLVIVLLFVHFIFQLLFPLRHLLVRGNVFWTAECKMWSWHMMSGGSDIAAKFFLVERDENDEELQWHELNPAKFLNKTQRRNLGKYPAQVPQFARFLKKEGELAGMTNVSVFADILVSRNDKPYRYVISPNQELAGLKPHFSLKHNDWILLYKAEDKWLYSK